MDTAELTPVQRDVLRIARHLDNVWPGTRLGSNRMIREKVRLRRVYAGKSLADLERIISNAEKQLKEVIEKEAGLLQAVDQHSDYLDHEMEKGKLDARVWYAVQLRAVRSRIIDLQLSARVASELIIRGKFAVTGPGDGTSLLHAHDMRPIEGNVAEATPRAFLEESPRDSEKQMTLTLEQREILSIARRDFKPMAMRQRNEEKQNTKKTLRLRPLAEIEECIITAESLIRTFEKLEGQVLADVEHNRLYAKDDTGNWEQETLQGWVKRLHTYWRERERSRLSLAACGEIIAQADFIGAKTSPILLHIERLPREVSPRDNEEVKLRLTERPTKGEIVAETCVRMGLPKGETVPREVKYKIARQVYPDEMSSVTLAEFTSEHPMYRRISTRLADAGYKNRHDPA